MEPRLKMRLDPKESGHRQSVDLNLRAVGSLEGKERFPRLQEDRIGWKGEGRVGEGL